MVEHSGSFSINKDTKIFVPKINETFQNAFDVLLERITITTGFTLKLVEGNGTYETNCIIASISEMILKPEAYTLTVKEDKIIITAQQVVGIFYAMQSIRQLLPPEIEKKEAVANLLLVVPCVEIVDEPRFVYRGFMLDVCRHFSPATNVKKYIDLLAMHKFNNFHWHLTEDQGWRIEIKKWPDLTQIGAWRGRSTRSHNSEGPHHDFSYAELPLHSMHSFRNDGEDVTPNTTEPHQHTHDKGAHKHEHAHKHEGEDSDHSRRFHRHKHDEEEHEGHLHKHSHTHEDDSAESGDHSAYRHHHRPDHKQEVHPDIAELLDPSDSHSRELLGASFTSPHPSPSSNAPYGGFYTHEQIKDVVAHAKKRFINIVPEIEMPGHALAALASYPQFSCTGGPFYVATTWGIFSDVFCAKNETFKFLEDVLTEVIDLFPGTLIHIGGDECPKGRWSACEKCKQTMQENSISNAHNLQSYFIKRIEAFVNSKGRRIIGWDEIMEGGLAPNAAVMSWRGTSGGIQAARADHDAVMTPMSHCYFDFSQERGATDLARVYTFDPLPSNPSEKEKLHIIGGQANLWRERVPDELRVEYMMFPRASALAETLWSSKATMNYNKFLERLRVQVKRFDAINLNYCKTNLQ